MHSKCFGALCLSLVVFGAAHGQSFKGKITLSRMPILLAPHQTAKNQAACGTHIPNEALIVGKQHELANVLVFIANLAPEADLPHAIIPLDMQNCAFRPHVLAVAQGDTLWLRNQDPILHDARGAFSSFRQGWDGRVTKDIFEKETQTAFNFVFPHAKAEALAILQYPGLIRLESTAGHDWMGAYIFVAPHRAFAVSNEKGEFTLPLLPNGKYDLVLWHEHLGVKRQLAEVTGGKTTELMIIWEISEEMHAPDTAPLDETPPN